MKGALIGFGFSMTENLLFFLYYGDLDRALWIRGVFFGLNHAFFTSLVGLALGAARSDRLLEAAHGKQQGRGPTATQRP